MPNDKFKLNKHVLKILEQVYAPDTFIERDLNGFHLNIKTDKYGRPELLLVTDPDKPTAVTRFRRKRGVESKADEWLLGR